MEAPASTDQVVPIYFQTPQIPRYLVVRSPVILPIIREELHHFRHKGTGTIRSAGLSPRNSRYSRRPQTLQIPKNPKRGKAGDSSGGWKSRSGSIWPLIRLFWGPRKSQFPFESLVYFAYSGCFGHLRYFRSLLYPAYSREKELDGGCVAFSNARKGRDVEKEIMISFRRR